MTGAGHLATQSGGLLFGKWRMRRCLLTMRALLAAAPLCIATSSLLAAESVTLAGLVGGADIRSAFLPAPGLYGGLTFSGREAWNNFDGAGNQIPAFQNLTFGLATASATLLYVPNIDVFGGRIGVLASAAATLDCGHLFAGPEPCVAGANDPYFELDWSRYFGTPRNSRYAGALPIREGLVLEAGLGILPPLGQYNPANTTTTGLNVGSNLWNFSPTVAATYTTAPIIGEGTEFSAKLFWNNFLPNPATDYATGAVLELDFAVTEHLGRWQFGFTGGYIKQIADDVRAGIVIPPDGHRLTLLALGGVVAYDMPEYASTIKVKVIAGRAIHENTTDGRSITIGLFKKLN